MANNNGGFIEFVSANATADLKEFLELVDKGVIAVNKINAGLKGVSLPSQGKDYFKGLSSEMNNQNKVSLEQQRITLKLADARKQDAITIAKLKIELAQLNKENKAAATQLVTTLNAYQKLDSELGVLRLQAKGLAADMFLLEQAGEQNSQEYKQLASTYEHVASRVNLLDTGLKKIDTQLGQNTRYVGEYQRGFNGLGNSINQLTREFPAFTYSIQTGLLGISNNIAPIADEINQLTAANRELAAQGKPTVSVLGQIGKALFSFQTLLSIGITLLTVYGAKIFEWATNVRKASTEVDALREATERYQNTIVETTTASERELTALQRKIAVAKDVTKSDEERLAAAKSIKEQYPGYLKSLKDEDVLLSSNEDQTNNYIKAVRQLTADIKKRVEAEAKQDKSRENLKVASELEQEAAIRRRTNQEALDLWNKYGTGQEKLTKREREQITERIKARQELLNEDKDFVSKMGQIGVNTSGSVSTLGLYTDAQITQIELRAQALRRVVETEQEEINKIFQETSLLDFKPDKQQIEELKDFYASEYELVKTRLENQAAANKTIFENEEEGYADRKAAAERYGEIIIQLADKKREETLRILALERDQSIKEINKRAKDEEISQINANAVISSIQKKYRFDSLKAYEDYSKDIIDANAEIEESLKGVWRDISDQEKQNEITKQQILNLRQLGLILDNVGPNTSLSQFADIENKMRALQKAEEDAQVESLKNQRQSLQGNIEEIQAKEKTAENNKEINDLLAKQYEIDKQILDIDNKRKLAVFELRKQLKQATVDYLSGFSGGFLNDIGFGSLSKMFDEVTYQFVNDLGQIETKSGSTFEKLFDQAQTTGEKFAVVFGAIGDVAKDAFAFMNQNSQAYFDAQYSRLDREKDIALKFAGESAEGREEIERQYDERRREIQRRELQAKKEQALFNAIINTAQGVTAALAEANYAGAILIGALGAAQIAFIASQDIPAYADGTDNHPGGLMLVNDAKGSSYRETIQTPDGRIMRPHGRNVLMDAPKGTIVHKAGAFDSYLNSVLSESGIAPFAGTMLKDKIGDVVFNQSNGITKDDLDSVMGKYTSQKTFNLSIDRNGINAYWKGQYTKENLIDNYIEAKGKKL